MLQFFSECLLQKIERRSGGAGFSLCNTAPHKIDSLKRVMRDRMYQFGCSLFAIKRPVR